DKRTNTDYTPTWVYDITDSENPGSPRPVVEGRKVGHALKGCDTTAVLPMYDSPTWRKFHYEMVRALGQRYNGHPQVTAVVVNTGLDGETQPVKDLRCPWNTHLDQQASTVRHNFGKFTSEVMAVYHQAFPNKTIFVNNAPGGSGTRKGTSDLAASFKSPIGLKHSGMWVDLDSHQGYGDFFGSWDLVRAYSMTLPIWLESPFGLGGPEQRYWSLIAGLHYHPAAIDLHPEYFTQSKPEWLRFTVAHLGVTLADTPSVWTVLRDSEYPLVSWGKSGVSGHMGDWAFWLYRLDAAPQSQTEVVLREKMPAAKEHIYSRQARRTLEAKNSPFMSFDIDDGYPYVAAKPAAVEGGKAHYRVHVTLLNTGDDTFALQYRNWDGSIVSQTRRKGPALGPVDDWVTVTFEVTDGYLDNNLPGGADFRLSSERDGDEYVHMVRVEGGWGAAPGPTPTPLAARTRSPTAGADARTVLPPLPSATLSPVARSPLLHTPTPLPGAARFDVSADTYLDQWAPSTAWGAAHTLAARQGDVRTPLLRFDLADVPSGAAIERAVLSLAVRGRSNPAPLRLDAHPLLRPWDEQIATWTRPTALEAWAAPGAQGAERDRAAAPTAQVWLEAEQGWVDLEVTEVVRAWAARPAANYGLALRGVGSTAVQYDLYGADHPDRALRPRLWVVWRMGGPGLPAPRATPTTAPKPERESTPAGAPTRTVLRPGDGYGGLADTYLDAWAPEVNYSSATILAVRQGGVRVPLLRFDLGALPKAVSIKRATLNLFVTARWNPGALALAVGRLNRPWDAAHATWLHATHEAPWLQGGAAEAGLDRSARWYAIAHLDGERRWAQWDVTDLVQEWALDPARNYGLLLYGQGQAAVQYDLAALPAGSRVQDARLR
ncbi:MAG: DNRLRE domain-containing protein, partial [Chloroflexota bacterium]